MHLAKRLAKLERIEMHTRPAYIAVRFVGRGADNGLPPTEAELRDCMTFIEVEFVAALDGRPA